jgi:hypothetical protein
LVGRDCVAGGNARHQRAEARQANGARMARVRVYLVERYRPGWLVGRDCVAGGNARHQRAGFGPDGGMKIERDIPEAPGGSRGVTGCPAGFGRTWEGDSQVYGVDRVTPSLPRGASGNNTRGSGVSRIAGFRLVGFGGPVP